MMPSEPLPLVRPITVPLLLATMRERWRQIAGIVLGVGVLMAVIALLLKPWFTAEARLLPPSENSDLMSNLTGMIEASTLNRVGLFTTATPSDLLVEILKSRRLREVLIRKFGLQQQYRRKNMDATLTELKNHMSVDPAKSGVVTIRMEARSREQAADMANFMVGELDRFNREVLNTRGKRLRQFMEVRIADAQRRMAETDSCLTAYERKHGVLISGDESSVRGISDVISQRIALQVKRGYVASFSSPEDPEVRKIEAELRAFDHELGPLPEIKNEGQRLVLDATIQRKVFSMLSLQYEQARVDEMRDIPTVTLLDDARPPDLKSRPKRALMVLGAMLMAFIGATAWVWWSLRSTPGHGQA
jgi:capsule polysaccharide export protein KpsE/RkpR